MIKDVLTKKVLAVVCAASLSVGSVAVAFATAGGADAKAAASASAVVTEEPSTVEPSTEEPSTEKPSVTPSENPTEPATEKPSVDPSAAPSQNPSEEPITEPVAEVTYSVVGPLVASIVGEADQWNAEKSVDMTQSKENENIYTLTIANVAPKTYEYQVLRNHSWSDKFSGDYFGDSSYSNLKVTVPETMDVTVTLDLSTMKVYTNLDTTPVEKTDLSAATVTLENSSVTFNNAKQTPVVKSVVLGDKTLVAGTDYTVEAMDVKDAGTYTVSVKGTGDYFGTATATWTIKAKSVKTGTAAVSSKTYTGKKLTSSSYSLKVKVGGKNVTLKKGTDYTVKSASRTTVGSSTVTFTGIGNYAGTVTAKFYVKAAKVSSKYVKVSSSKSYTGKTVKATVKVKIGSKTLKNGTDYKVTYKNNKKIGKATATVTFKGNYTGTIKKSFKIVPAKASIKSVKNKKAKTATVTFKKIKGAKTYQVSYKLKSAKKWKTVSTKKTSVVLTKLKKGKTYQVKVTAVTKVGKTSYKGTASKVKTVKIKK